MGAKRLIERMALSGTVGGTAEAPVIEGVLLCGPTSANRRRYKAEAFAGDRVKLYNGAPVKITAKHGDSGALYQEEIGIVQNARLRADGMPVGDLAINPHKPLAEAFIWDARNQPKACGMSHVAQCDTVPGKDGWDEVTELLEAVSVDVIGARGAATTKGLFESKGGRDVKKLTAKQLSEWVARHPKSTLAECARAKKFAEDMGAMGMADAPVADEPDEACEPGSGLKGGIKAGIMEIIDEAMDDPAKQGEALKKIKTLLGAHADVSGAGKPKDGPKKDDEPEPTPESRKRPDPWTVLAEARKIAGPQYNPGPAELEALAGLATPEARAAYIAEQRAKQHGGGTDPKSSGRYKPLAEANGSGGGDGTPAADVKSFLSRVMD